MFGSESEILSPLVAPVSSLSCKQASSNSDVEVRAERGGEMGEEKAKETAREGGREGGRGVRS